jgi:hypothetical protein
MRRILIQHLVQRALRKSIYGREQIRNLVLALIRS